MSEATVYLYWHGNTPYPTVVGPLQEKLWLVIFSIDSIMETAFIVENPDNYLQPQLFERIGLLSEVLHDS